MIDIAKIDQAKNPRDAIAGQPEVGIGPLHTTFDGRGNAYTSLFIDSQIVKWNIEKAVARASRTTSWTAWMCITTSGTRRRRWRRPCYPKGEYLLSLNKLSKGMFLPVGPSMPENQELIDISGAKMKLLASFPAEPEPHDAVFMEAEDLIPKVAQVDQPAPNAVAEGQSREEQVGPREVHVYMTAIRSKFVLAGIRRSTRGTR